MSTKAQREIAHKLRVFEHARHNGNVAFTCRYFGISRGTFYRWRRNYLLKGEQGLINSKSLVLKILNCAHLKLLKSRLFIYAKPIIPGNCASVGIYNGIIKLAFLLMGFIRYSKEIA